jgi:redox-sensitive bicupin YhaK (pirin superfamily)
MIDLVIDQRRKDLGGFEVGRVLPFHSRRMVGPFTFFDHMGPARFAPGFEDGRGTPRREEAEEGGRPAVTQAFRDWAS